MGVGGATGSSGIRIAFLFAGSGGTFPSLTSAAQLPIGQFSHLVGTWDGTTLRLYINGVLDTQKVAGATPQDSGYGVYIGGFSIASGATYFGQYFNGLIDEASYYGRALNGAEIASLYNAGSAGECPASAVPFHHGAAAGSDCAGRLQRDVQRDGHGKPCRSVISGIITGRRLIARPAPAWR